MKCTQNVNYKIRSIQDRESWSNGCVVASMLTCRPGGHGFNFTFRRNWNKNFKYWLQLPDWSSLNWIPEKESWKSESGLSALQKSALPCLYMSVWCNCVLDILRFSQPGSYPQVLSIIGFPVTYYAKAGIAYFKKYFSIVVVYYLVVTLLLLLFTLEHWVYGLKTPLKLRTIDLLNSLKLYTLVSLILCHIWYCLHSFCHCTSGLSFNLKSESG